MNVAVASGKGGTGKTFVSVNLAAACAPSVYADCDAEEPNGALFLHPAQTEERAVCVRLPVFDAARCTGCRACVDFCRFHALAYVGHSPIVFPDICHSCGGCALVCPNGAVSETDRPVGRVVIGPSGAAPGVTVVSGALNPGEESAVPVIRAVLDAVPPDAGDVLMDCPPGVACPAVECLSRADYCLLVAEGTAFGLHNLRMAHRLARALGVPCGVVVNRCAAPYAPLEGYCAEQGLEILLRIPFDRALARALSEGRIPSRESEEWADRFRALMDRIRVGQAPRAGEGGAP